LKGGLSSSPNPSYTVLEYTPAMKMLAMPMFTFCQLLVLRLPQHCCICNLCIVQQCLQCGQ